jgi:predicted transposase YbfD/YdcC
VTVDAMGTQKQIAREIKEADADYVMALKGNHEVVHAEVKTFLDATVQEAAAPRPPGKHPSAAVAGLATLQTVEKDHGRIETRTYYQSAVLDWFADRGQWEGLKTIGMVEAEREVGGKKTVERRYYLSSLPLGVETFARAVRGHWSVENSLHWVLDVQMREDESRARTGHAAENLATAPHSNSYVSGTDARARRAALVHHSSSQVFCYPAGFRLRRLAESLAMIVEELLVGWRRVWRRAKQPLVAVMKFQFLLATSLQVASTV